MKEIILSDVIRIYLNISTQINFSSLNKSTYYVIDLAVLSVVKFIVVPKSKTISVIVSLEE